MVMCAIAHELLLTVVGYVVYMWHGRMAAADRSLQAQLAITNWAQTSRRGLLPWTCVVQPQATAIASSFFSVSSLMCSMITRRFRKQGSCKYLDQQEGHAAKSKADQNFRMERMLFRRCDGHCSNGCCIGT